MTRNKKLEVTEEKVPVEAAKRIVVNADLAGPYAEELESKLCVALAAPVQGPLILDLKKVGSIDSNGIALCIGLAKECAAKKIACVIEAPGELFKLFSMMKLNVLFDIREVSAA